ncbi:CANT1-like protein [Mya arenaria]|uniref:CANT1-like protein n=2 Tax=Mya arenaria TaxID=6604 RepID=A0ABY7DN39_MYAAR|nr:soluble calcium-activated nucleotidase 1-like isoform X1 [Mya arenaria]WAQ97483.1 CANT1-like protein [Mya arenaria]
MKFAVACWLMSSESDHIMYDNKYPLASPIKTQEGTQYRIAIVSDLDKDSKSPDQSNTWVSYLKYGHLKISDDNTNVAVQFDETITLTSQVSAGGRGMELSELIVFNGKLYTLDDRTGIVYEIVDNKVIQRYILTDGDGSTSKGFKCEWATVKDNRLYVGGLGKEWTTDDGEVVNTNHQWVKSIGVNGDIQHHDWKDNYNALREKVGMNLPGYMIHESAVWSSVHQRWFFMPRKASKLRYDENADEKRATNLLFTATEDFKNIEVSTVGEINPTHGFSSFKFVPGTNHNVIVALKSEEDGANKATYIMVFDVEGNILYEEMKIGDAKFEGIEFV